MDDLDNFPLEEDLDSLVAHGMRDLTAVLGTKHHPDMEPVHVPTANTMLVYIQSTREFTEADARVVLRRVGTKLIEGRVDGTVKRIRKNWRVARDDGSIDKVKGYLYTGKVTDMSNWGTGKYRDYIRDASRGTWQTLAMRVSVAGQETAVLCVPKLNKQDTKDWERDNRAKLQFRVPANRAYSILHALLTDVLPSLSDKVQERVAADPEIFSDSGPTPTAKRIKDVRREAFHAAKLSTHTSVTYHMKIDTDWRSRAKYLEGGDVTSIVASREDPNMIINMEFITVALRDAYAKLLAPEGLTSFKYSKEYMDGMVPFVPVVGIDVLDGISTGLNGEDSAMTATHEYTFWLMVGRSNFRNMPQDKRLWIPAPGEDAIQVHDADPRYALGHATSPGLLTYGGEMDTDERKLKNIVTSLNEALTADKDDQSNGVAMCDVRIAGVGTDVPKDTEGAGIVRLQVYGQGQRDALIKNAQKIPGIHIMEDNAETLAQLQQFAELCRRDETAQSFLGPPPAYKARGRGRGKGKWAKGAPKGEVQRAREMSGSGSLPSGAGPYAQRRDPMDSDIKAVINSFEGTLTALMAQMIKMQEQQSRMMEYLLAGTQQAHTPIRSTGAAAAMAAAASSPARLGGTDTHGKRPRNSSTDEEQEEEARRQAATQGMDHLGLHGDMEDQDDDDQ